jgi:4-hydroxybenzoate polyprenyltransferase
MKEQGLQSSRAVLIVTLDDCLVAPETMLESFWTAASANGWKALSVLGPGAGRAARLESVARTAPQRLHYREDVITAIQSWREAGGRAVLIAPAAEPAAPAIAAHLGLFDAVEHTACDGPDFDDAMASRYGPGGFARLAPGTVFNPDFALPGAATTFSANAPERPADDARPRFAAKPALRLIRPHQWAKNALVFVPMLAAHQFTLDAVWHAALAFVAFSLIASATYVLNDLLDLNADRAHPRKRNRPLASGEVSLAQGTAMVPLLALAGIGAALLSGLPLLGTLAAYAVFTTAYSLHLKRLVVVDICALAVLYTMRILAGSAATGIDASMWLLAFSTFFFFSLAAIKRLAELVDGVKAGRSGAHGRGYIVDDVAIVSNIAVSAGLVSVLVLALYANSEQVQLLYHRPEMLWASCLVLLFWNSRIAILTQRGQMHDDPLVFAVRDRVSLVCGALVGALALAGTVA